MRASDELDELIRAARPREDPTPEERASVRRAVALRIAGGFGVAGAGGELRARRAVSSSLASMGMLPVLALVVLGGLSADVSRRDPAPAEAAAGARTPKTSKLRPRLPNAIDPELTQQPAQTSTLPASGETTANPVSRDREAEPRATPGARRQPLSSPEPRAQSGGPGLAAESRALAAVQRALRDREPERALGLLGEQDRTFARGALAQERAAARVMALCDAGRTHDAELASAAFAASHPSSPLLARVRESCSRGARR